MIFFLKFKKCCMFYFFLNFNKLQTFLKDHFIQTQEVKHIKEKIFIGFLKVFGILKNFLIV